MSKPQKTMDLSRLADIVMGQSPESSAINDKEIGLPFLQGCAEFGRQSPKATVHCFPPLRIAKSDSILISVRAPVGKTNWGEQEYCIGRGLGAIKAKKGISNTEFLRYAVDQYTSFLHKRSQGSTFLAVGANDLKGFPIPYFPVPLQEKIAGILSTIDQAIEHTEALIEKYQHIKAGMMQDLFTRGVTADGKLRPPKEQAPELYQETPIGWIPKEWCCSEIKKYTRSAEYGISTSLGDLETGIPVLRMNNIQSNKFDVLDLKYTTNLDAYKIKLKRRDVLYNRTNSMEHVGKTAIWRDELPECSFASYLVRINLYIDCLLPEYFTHWMSQVSSQNALRRYATPAVQQVNINPTNLQRVLISCPTNIEEQARIVERIDGVDSKINTELVSLRKLVKQRQGLMHDLLTGEVPVTIDSPEESHV